jgi:hypothetical protein
MADAETMVESSAPPDVQKQAEQMGWIPPSRFRGDPERFVDADTYIKRGEEVLPIVREQNKRLHTELDAVKADAAKTQAALKAAQTAIDQMEERHTVATQKAVEDARKQLKAQLAAASEAGDHEGVAELTDKLTLMSTAEAPAAKAPVATPTPPVFVPPPELIEWNSENPWFGQDKRKTALALAVAQELRDGGETSQGRTFFDKVLVEVDKTLGVQAPRGDKVEGARGGSDGGEARSSGRGKGYAALPADAKSACDAEARRFVGEGKKYKTQADWRNRYAEIYFGE